MDTLAREINNYRENEIVYRDKVFIDNTGKELSYIIYRDEDYFTAQCLDINIASFGETIDEAKTMIKEALELYFRTE
ncbi:MAG: type II toxin-antitoxin system HicB family antitoxin [Candidatus Eremiobacterota bacterium]